MAKFDLKIALNLLPVMTDDVYNTKQLIDGIEYYKSIIDTESHKELIMFVLKSRLSQHAKLKISKNYESIDALLVDMKRILLPQKSAHALQKQLLNSRQNDLSIDDYGKKLSEMFVELTITQAGGDSNKYEVLRSVNENQAIKQFSEGLRNSRVGMIVAAQKFHNLKDAIQAAIDEDCSSSDATVNMLPMRRSNINSNNINNNFRTRSYFNNQRGYNRGAYNKPRNYYFGSQSRGGQQWHQPGPPAAHRGRGYFRGIYSITNINNNNNPHRANIQVLTEESQTNNNNSTQTQPNTSGSHDYSENEFFRG